MQSKCVVILCTKKDYVETMFKNLKKQDDKDILICLVIESRIAGENLKEELKSVVKKYNASGLDVKFCDDVIINNYVSKALNFDEKQNRFLEIYTMAMNINAQYYLLKKMKFKQVLFLDDDVLINGQLSDVFDFNCFGFTRNCLSSGRGCEGKDFMNELLMLSGVDYKTYLSHNINGGVKLYINERLDVYEWLLKEFYSNDIFYKYWKMFKQTGKMKSVAWFLDQFFDNAFAWRIGENMHILEPVCRTVWTYTPKYRLKDKNLYTNKVLTHYACGKLKKEFLKDLHEAGVIK